jgi:nitroimidazol reductase NimA-like FMN-containing flavoprotein (pyridoxamine 5'-phosphate oxidase superfamily)
MQNMRRKDREVSDFDEMLDILQKCAVGRLGLSSPSGEPYVVPVCFGFSAEGGRLTVYAHSASEGQKIKMIQENESACFEADRAFRIYGPEEGGPCALSCEYESVIAFGKASLAESAEDKKKALDAILAHYEIARRAEYGAGALEHVAVIKLEASRATAKRNVESNDAQPL